jgi:hypothetical protein
MRFAVMLVFALLLAGCLWGEGPVDGPVFEGRQAVDLLPESISGYTTGEINTKSQGDCVSGASGFYYKGELEDYDVGALVMVCELGGGSEAVLKNFSSRSTEDLCSDIYSSGAFKFCQAVTLENGERAIVSWFETGENPVWLYWGQDRFYYYVIFESTENIDAFGEAVRIANVVVLEQYGNP